LLPQRALTTLDLSLEAGVRTRGFTSDRQAVFGQGRASRDTPMGVKSETVKRSGPSAARTMMRVIGTLHRLLYRCFGGRSLRDILGIMYNPHYQEILGKPGHQFSELLAAMRRRSWVCGLFAFTMLHTSAAV
jgi:hypothetical protein